MTKVIAVATNKGGIGKTTSVVYLATALSAHGNVLAVDLDLVQGTLTGWARAAAASDAFLPFDVVALDAKRFRQGQDFSEYDYVLVDTPPGNMEGIEAAVELSDLLIAPVRPGPLEEDRLWATLEAVQGIPTVVLTVDVERGTALTSKFRAELEARISQEGSTLVAFSQEIPHRQSIRRAPGTTPKDLEGYGHVAAELTEFLNEL